ncbi:hypothetical protein KEM60_00359 [Austwickia sp. TVS 96-490-7B]|nr:hypothetical protein [Austwickia sp. TVS 96-490-7B]
MTSLHVAVDKETFSPGLIAELSTPVDKCVDRVMIHSTPGVSYGSKSRIQS